MGVILTYQGTITSIISYFIYASVIIAIYYFISLKLPNWSVKLKHPFVAVISIVVIRILLKIVRLYTLSYILNTYVIIVFAVIINAIPLLVLLICSEKIKTQKQWILPISITLILPFSLILALKLFISVTL